MMSTVSNRPGRKSEQPRLKRTGSAARDPCVEPRSLFKPCNKKAI